VNGAELARLIDHSVLKPEATEADIHAGAAVVREWRIGFFCVQPCWVRVAAVALADTDALIVSVAGFPHGADRAEVKASAAARAVGDGAAEIDMVLNFGALKSGLVSVVATEIEGVVRAVPDIPIKVILETAALSDVEKDLACRLARDAGAAFVKTSTGFHPAGGATVEDVRRLRAAVGQGLGVKASGGIRTLAHALAMIDAGANRVGTSASTGILAALPTEAQGPQK
jgi:deoxyribose-phosphate aldolase